jgi:hypothetical protein
MEEEKAGYTRRQISRSALMVIIMSTSGLIYDESGLDAENLIVVGHCPTPETRVTSADRCFARTSELKSMHIRRSCWAPGSEAICIGIPIRKERLVALLHRDYEGGLCGIGICNRPKLSKDTSG